MRFLVALALALAACASTHVDPAQYDQTCSQDADCVPVLSGDLCVPCPCPNAAIRTSAQAAHDADVAAARDACGTTERVECSPCPPHSAACASGHCVLR